MDSFAFFSALRFRALAKIFRASSGSSRPSASIRIGQRLQRGLDTQHFFFGRAPTLEA